ncbi:MAG: ACP S-malonyltransferase [Albidovulum sp.]|nr:ACP S-malonyltransferase [Albidovulum sp.]MDE0306519.1 ACP S-malonyltransferase [Albidovulum sp.]MDE0531221.1 ACP S-malonyltransferase [Albidovulum sp.]
MAKEHRAFVFPGQGAQRVGMGRDIAQSFPAAMLVYEEVDEALGEAFSDTVWNGTEEVLQLTRNAQPALMATSMAALRALEAEGVPISLADYMAGHSLGEYTALCAAGSISIGDAARLLRTRGEAMQRAVPLGDGAMAALLGLDLESATSVARDASQGEICGAANDNDPKQVVVSGHRGAVERAVRLAKSRGARRAVMLPVSAPFHCSLMEPAAEEMACALESVNFRRPNVPVVANVSANPEFDPAEIKRNLVEQVTRTVRWRETILWMIGEGVSQICEIGVGSALSGMARRIDKSLDCIVVNDAGSLRSVAMDLRKQDGDV